MLIGVRGSRAAAPKGTKSCRTQGDFCWSCLRSKKADLRPKRANFRPEKVDCRPERADFRPERARGMDG